MAFSWSEPVVMGSAVLVLFVFSFSSSPTLAFPVLLFAGYDGKRYFLGFWLYCGYVLAS